MLAFACAFTMFAGAAFTDQADIKATTDVVDTLVSLGVIEGFEDGSFQPNTTVTRAQMAKMIYVLRTGNSDASAYNDDKTSFHRHWHPLGSLATSSTASLWASLLVSLTPSLLRTIQVTAQEAAKMLLVTLGYDRSEGWSGRR